MYPPPPRGPGFARTIFTTLAAVIFAGSLALNAYLLLAWGLTSSVGSIRATVIQSGDPTSKIAVIPISGLIMSGAVDKFNRALDAVNDDPTVKALVIELNTPGGGVTASDEIHHRIEQFKARTHKKVIIQMTELAASGGYYIASAGDYLMAEPTTMTGSIGVMMPLFDLTGLGNKYGIHDASLHSTGADFKEVGSPFQTLTPVQKDYLIGLIDQDFATFKSIVVAGRKKATNPLTEPIDKIANGKVYTAKQAKALGLIDSDTAYPDDVYKQAATMAGLTKKPEVVKYQVQSSLLDMFTGKSQLSSPAASTSVNGININVDPELIQNVLSPQPMYLWRR